MACKLIIIGLRRSGTTIFWETFRQDRRLQCYDEPLNPWLAVLPGTRGLKHPQEFLKLLETDPLEFWSRYDPVVPTDELREGLSDRQRAYLAWLFDRSSQVAIDTTRCQFKVETLLELAPEATLVHLYRPPESHASSHLLPGHTGRWRKLRRWQHRAGFWTRPDNYDFWSFETIVGSSPRGLFGHRLSEAGLDPKQVYALPAVGKLMAFWRVNFERAERDGGRFYGKRFVSQNFDEFCRHPRQALERIYGAMDLSLPEFDLSRIHPARGPHQPRSAEWLRYGKLLGLPPV